LLNTFSTEADVHDAQKVLSNNGFRMANCFCYLSQNAMVCLACGKRVVKITTKVLKNCKTFSSRPRPRPNFKTKTKTKTSCYWGGEVEEKGRRVRKGERRQGGEGKAESKRVVHHCI